MPVIWNLKKWLAVERDIYRAADLQAVLRDRAGVVLSHQAVAALINGQPSALRLQTIQALCNALDCKLSDFCEVLPDAEAERRQRKAAGAAPRRLYGDHGEAPPPTSPFPAVSDYYPPGSISTPPTERRR